MKRARELSRRKEEDPYSNLESSEPNTPNRPRKILKRKKLASNLTLQKLSKRLEEAVSSTSSDSEQSILNSGEPLYNIQHESAEVEPNHAFSYQELEGLQTGEYTSLDGAGAFPEVQGRCHVLFYASYRFSICCF